MKKIAIKFTAIIMLFALTLSLAGCGAFQATNNNNQNNNNNSSQPVIQTLNKAEFGVIEGDRTGKNKLEVIANARASVVSIAIANSSSSSAGSGVIVDMTLTDEEGTPLDTANDIYVLTCHHVVDGLGDIVVYLPDAELDNVGESDYDIDNYAFEGKIGNAIYTNNAVTLVGGDEKSDVALLKIRIDDSEIANKIVKAKFPPNAGYQMQVGEDVFAVGNPSGGAPGTVTVGNISYLYRETSIDSIGKMTLIQIDADIEHGSSGGGLFNMYGELIGLTNAGSDTYPSINYAIPYVVDANKGTADFGFQNVAGQLLATKTSTNYGYVTGRRGEFGFVVSQALIVTDVVVGSVSSSWLQKGDIVRKIAKGDSIDLIGVPKVTSINQVTEVITSLSAGDKVSMLIERDGDDKTVTMIAPQYKFCDTGN